MVAQSARGDLYAAALRRLEDAGAVYPCFCSRADIRAAASAPHGVEGHRYPGTCRALPPEVATARLSAGEEAALRFRADGTVTFDDAVHGPVSEELSDAGDFVVRRRDGVVAYQLAVVVDDADQDVDQVLRGDDLLPSTGRQIALRAALGLDPGAALRPRPAAARPRRRAPGEAPRRGRGARAARRRPSARSAWSAGWPTPPASGRTPPRHPRSCSKASPWTASTGTPTPSWSRLRAEW